MTEKNKEKLKKDNKEISLEEMEEKIEKKDEKMTELEDKLKKLKEQNKELKKDVENYKDKLNRVMADFDNFRKRMNKEKSNIIKNANEQLIVDILPILDNLELAVNNVDVEDDNSPANKIIEGVNLVIKQFKKVLKDNGVKTIKAVGGAFDPNFHDALQMVETEEDHDEEELVVEEFQKGYMLKDKVIRPAKVKVSKKKNKNQKEEDSNG